MLKIGWTTVGTVADAETMAEKLVEAGLAVCVQREGPLHSTYRWEGRLESSTEYRLTIKFLPEKQADLERALFAQHPYEVPEWLVVFADRVGEKYLSWAQTRSERSPF